jgi:hypothetical protein
MTIDPELEIEIVPFEPCDRVARRAGNRRAVLFLNERQNGAADKNKLFVRNKNRNHLYFYSFLQPGRHIVCRLGFFFENT